MAEVDETTAGGPDSAVDRPLTPFRPAAEATLADGGQICPFLATEGPDGALRAAIGWPGPVNRCTAFGEPQPQSDRQQELVCLTDSHVNCPRYLRGVLLAGTTPPKPARQPISAAVIASGLVLATALAASFGFLIVRGGFDLPSASPGGSRVAAAPTPSPSPTFTSTPGTSPSAEATASPTTSPSLAPTPAPTPLPTSRPTPHPTSDRYALLTACPSTPDCWIYSIRSGDNLQSIANWFGVSYDRMLAMNPGLSIPIHPGDPLRIPTPTR